MKLSQGQFAHDQLTTVASADHHGRPDWHFGSGLDGDVTIASNTTLTRDMWYNNLTVNSSRNLITDGFRVFVRGILTLTGSIIANGSAGSNRS